MAQRLLFGGTQGAAPQSKYLVEFRAGKCTQKGKLVTPDKRKGLVYIQQTDDSLIHFCWKDRTTGQTEEDLIMFPGDAEFEKVTQCTTGRVFVLKFKSNNKHCFYWMQEPKTDKDDDYKTKVNQFLNEPSAQHRGAGGSSGGGNNFNELSEDQDLNSFISGMSHRELIQLFGMGNPGNLSALLNNASRQERRVTTVTEPSAVATPASGTSSGASKDAPKANRVGAPKGAGIKPQNLADILNKVNAEVNAAGGSGGNSGGQVQAEAMLSTLTNADALEPIINNSELMARVKEFLPASDASTSESIGSQVRFTLKSPQFQQAVSMFSAALSSGQMGPLMTQFGMSDDVATAAATGNLEDFIKALEKSKKAEESTDVEMN